MANDKARFSAYQLGRIYWGTVAGNPAEPVKLDWENGRLVGRTLGCPDAFDLEDPECPLLILTNSADNRPTDLNFLSNAHTVGPRPIVPARLGGPPARQAAKLSPKFASHGWRGPLNGD